ncbi:hypothetical protein D3227_18515 [Mesorhizobium waimense]|uniref:Uncharacterized protein n=1 Tax=Mesorhizobium waimense TaxID=1300307 RepID=A0A3A5KXW6_9HYPH|nr:hypothetical protein D3227_18515 [Mesorhizobium waimense]
MDVQVADHGCWNTRCTTLNEVASNLHYALGMAEDEARCFINGPDMLAKLAGDWQLVVSAEIQRRA